MHEEYPLARYSPSPMTNHAVEFARAEPMNKGTILIVDDEADILVLVTYNLAREGYKTATAESGEAALDEVKRIRPDLILLDLMLPGLDGVEVCKNLRSSPMTSHIPIIMLTAKAEEADVVTGLEVGADDYVTKPFSPRVLLARIKSVLHKRRTVSAANSNAEMRFGDIVILIGEHQCRVLDKPVDLTATEFRILLTLLRRPGWVFSRDQIVESSRGENAVVTLRSVDVHIVRLRSKLEPCGDYIETVRGVGYRIREPEGK